VANSVWSEEELARLPAWTVVQVQRPSAQGDSVEKPLGRRLTVAVACISALTTSVHRARTATSTLCLLVETAADLYSPLLADQLRVPYKARVTPETGHDINNLLRKDPI
jgi:hypothetical protein